MPAGKMVRIGAWEASRFIGCVLFGSSANGDSFSPYGVGQDGGAELTRIALREHEAPVTRIVAISLRMLHKLAPGLRIVVSYADPEQGHLGTIYQAGGWVYTGRTVSMPEFIVRGRRMHKVSVFKMRCDLSGTRMHDGSSLLTWLRQNVDPNAQQIAGSSKHRYVMPLDDAMRAVVAPMALPYPRRRSVDNDAPAIHAGEGGVIPTRRLRRPPVR